MQLRILCFASGVWLLQQQANLPEWSTVWLLGATLPAVVLLRGHESRAARAMQRIGMALLCLAAGYCWAVAFAHQRLADRLPVEWEGRDVAVIGVVASLPQADARSVRFQFDVERVLTPAAQVPQGISLGWWGSAGRDARGVTLPDVRAGERWQLTVRLRRPRGTANPNGFDYEAWLLERGIRATGYVRVKADNQRLSAMVHAPRYWVEVVRARVRERIRRALPEQPYAGVIIALAVGDQRAIAPEQWQVYTRTGVNHLMSISGLHVTMVSGLVFAVTCWLWRRSPRLALRMPASRAAAAFGLMAAFGYTLLAGFAVPAQRTLYMLGVAAIAVWLGMTSSASAILAAALFVVLVLDPWAVLAPGFWLSFGAVAVILYVTVGRLVRPHWLRNWATVQWAVTVALVPPLLALFQQVSLVSPVANAVAIPLVGLVVVPLTLAGVAAPFDLPLHAAHFVMQSCMGLLEWLSALPDAVWQQHAPPRWAIVAAIVGIAWMLLPRGFPARGLGAVLCLPLFLSAPAQLAEGEAKLTVLDVGHGLAVVVQTRHHALLYDTGPAFGPGADSGTRIIVPYLRASGIRRLDGMVVSHDDIDHSGGAASVLSAMPVAWVLTSLPDVDPLLFESEQAWRCHSGQSWVWDGVRFEIMGPTLASYEDATLKDNDRSCVLKIATPSGHVLLPADIERRAEGALLDDRGSDLYADVLVAPHQGSRTSSSAEFVERVLPQIVIFPVGYRNRFGHPHKEVVERYRATGAKIYRTDRDGAITLVLASEGRMRIEPFRAVYRRYWQTPFAGELPADPEAL